MRLTTARHPPAPWHRHGEAQCTEPDDTSRPSRPRSVSHSPRAAGAARFGSVTQSTNRGADGVTTDRASAAFTDGRSSVTVARQGESALTLSDDRAVPDYVRTGSARDVLTGIPGAARTLRNWAIVNVTGTEVTLSRLASSWADDDPADWLAGGYWVHLTGTGFGSAWSLTGVEYGAFVDGPELRSPPASRPSLGTATCSGLASGAYFMEYGTDVAVPRGSTELGEFQGVARLTADFADNSISGCMGLGCAERIETAGVIRNGLTGAWRNFTNVRSDIRADFGAARVDENGRFSDGRVTLSSPGVRVVHSAGSWGGTFLNKPVATGEPHLVAGTTLDNATTSGGTRLYFVGAFAAGKR